MAKVIVYTGTVCPWCEKVKDFLKDNKVEFEERNVNDVAEYARELQDKSGSVTVPVTDIEGKIVIGYNVPMLKKALGL